MTPAAILNTYRRMINERGETIAVRRYTGVGPSRTYTDVDVMAVVVGYEPKELVGSIAQGDRKVIMLAEDLSETILFGGSLLLWGDEAPGDLLLWGDEAPGSIILWGNYDPVITIDDRLVVRGRELKILAADDSTRRVTGVLIAYEIQARGG